MAKNKTQQSVYCLLSVLEANTSLTSFSVIWTISNAKV